MTASAHTRTVGLRQASHRCDACGAPARVLVILTNGGDLVFCEHHARQYRDALKPITVLFEHLPDGPGSA